jgi:hypothetical protein
MAVATVMAHGAHPWVAPPGAPSKEAALGYLAFGLLMLLAGPGKISLDALLLGKKTQIARDEDTADTHFRQDHLPVNPLAQQ